MNPSPRSRKALSAGAVAVPALLALGLFLAGEGRSRDEASSRDRLARSAFQELDDDLCDTLQKACREPGLPWPPAGRREDAFENLARLMPLFPPGSALEVLDAAGVPVAWEGGPLPPANSQPDPRLSLVKPEPVEEAAVLAEFGVFLFLGRSARIPGPLPPVYLTAWVPLDLVDPVLRDRFPGPCLASELEGRLRGPVRVLLAPPNATGAAAPADAAPASPRAVFVLGPGHPSRFSVPGPWTSLAGGTAVLLLLALLGRALLKASKPPAVARFALFFLLCAATRAALWGLHVPGAILGGPAFDPALFCAPILPGVGETAGDFVLSALFATAVTSAFLVTVPLALHRVIERSRIAAAVTVAALPFSVPLLSLALHSGVESFVASCALAGFGPDSPVDLFPAGQITLSLPGTLLLTGFFLFSLCFALLGTTALHAVFRALRGIGHRKAALLTVLAAAAATATVLARPDWWTAPVLVPAAVLLCLHLVHLRLRHDGITALHMGVFLLAASVAAFPALARQTERAKETRAEAILAEATAASWDVEAAVNGTLRTASLDWRGPARRTAPYLPFLFWAKSPLSAPGLSVWLNLQPAEIEGRSTFESGSPPEWPYYPPQGEVESIEIGGRRCSTIGNAALPDGLKADIFACRDWPPERPSFPPSTRAEPGLAFSRYEGGRLVRTTQPDVLPGRRLPAAIPQALARKVWVREQHEWGNAKVLYAPGPEAGTVVSAALPVPPFWGEMLGFLRLFLSGVLCAAAGALFVALLRARRMGRVGFHRRMKVRLAASFAVLSVVPIVLLGFYTESETVERVREGLMVRSRGELDLLEEGFRGKASIMDMAQNQKDGVPGLTRRKMDGIVNDDELKTKARTLRAEFDVFLPPLDGGDPVLTASSRPEARSNHLMAARLPGPVLRDLVLGQNAYRFDLDRRGPHLVVHGYRRLADADLRTVGVLAGTRFVPSWVLDASTAREVSLILDLYLLSLIVAGFLGLFLARRIALPLEQLTEATRVVAAGDFSHRVALTARDEIGDLVDSFNTMTAQLEANREALVRAEKESAWREMARQIAHEIKNPLTPMKLSAQHIVRAHRDGSEKFPEILQEGIRRITEQVDALGRIAQEFSDFARFPRRDLKRLDLNALAHGAVQLVAEEARGAFGDRIAFRETYDDALPAVVADEDEIRRVFINLLRNALQAMAETGGELRVATARARGARPLDPVQEKKGKTRFIASDREREGERLFAEIRVADTGPGIAEGLRDKLFQPYFSTKSGGTGLGLAICKKTVDDLGGEIVIESEEGAGATVIVRLPAAPEG